MRSAGAVIQFLTGHLDSIIRFRTNGQLRPTLQLLAVIKHQQCLMFVTWPRFAGTYTVSDWTVYIITKMHYVMGLACLLVQQHFLNIF